YRGCVLRPCLPDVLRAYGRPSSLYSAVYEVSSASRTNPEEPMEQIKSFADERHAAFCAGCGGAPETRDHVPSKVLLDEPYPENLPVVGVCASCNQGVSLDEEYTACVIECARLGARRLIFHEEPFALAARLAGSTELVPSQRQAAQYREILRKRVEEAVILGDDRELPAFTLRGRAAEAVEALLRRELER
ncbi:MAG TPA: hypothetical protein VFP80_11320, partial [Thermoanaerobaculia bacterium]|nr:hypothetical protein [Thermoanaerobaculia bacterium]